MPIERFFDPNLHTHDKEGRLEGDECHHALKVFRLHVGDSFDVINGHGLLAHARLVEITKKYLVYHVESHIQVPESIPRCSLVLGMPKFNRLEFIAEKVCELGCDQIILFNADRSEKTDLSKNQLERLNLILQSALKQCGRLYLPALEFRSHLESCFDTDRTYFFGDLETDITFTSPLPAYVGIVIGPESGFSDKEKALLNQKATGVSLSDATLRVDTAAIAAVCLIKNAL